MNVLKLSRKRGAVPSDVLEVGEGLEHSGELGGAGWRPSVGPGGAGLPQLQDRCAGVSGAGVGIRIAGFACPVGCVDKSGSVMGEPADKGVVRPSGIELAEDLLAEVGDGVSGR